MKTLIAVIALFSLQATTQAQKLEILNPKVQPGDVLIVKNQTDWAPQPCISTLSTIFQPNRRHMFFVGIDIQTQADKKLVSIVECEKGVELTQEVHGYEILDKDFVVRNRRLSSSSPRWERERKIIETSYDRGDYFEQYFDGEFIEPLDRIVIDSTRTIGDVSSPFGEGHRGVDLITLDPRTRKHARQVKAINSGKVALIAKNFSTDGNMVIIDHGSGIFSVYMHLSRFMVSKVGERVTKGKVIALSGRTGSAARGGPHLHFAVKVRDENKLNDVYVDPLAFIDTMNRYMRQNPH